MSALVTLLASLYRSRYPYLKALAQVSSSVMSDVIEAGTPLSPREIDKDILTAETNKTDTQAAEKDISEENSVYKHDRNDPEEEILKKDLKLKNGEEESKEATLGDDQEPQDVTDDCQEEDALANYLPEEESEKIFNRKRSYEQDQDNNEVSDIKEKNEISPKRVRDNSESGDEHTFNDLGEEILKEFRQENTENAENAEQSEATDKAFMEIFSSLSKEERQIVPDTIVTEASISTDEEVIADDDHTTEEFQ